MTVVTDIAEEAVRTAESLLRAGDITTAVAVLDRAGSPNPRADAGRLLISIRAGDFERADRRAATPWPRSVQQMLAPPGVIPEISPAQLSARTLADGVVGSGSMIVRGLMRPDRAEHLCRQIDRVLQARDRVRGGEQTPELSALFQRFDPGMSTFAGDSAAYVLDSPLMTLEVGEVYRELGVTEAVADYLGERPAVSLRKWVLRRVPADANTGWHQDGNFLGESTRNVNLWISLTPSGESAPGLDIVAFRIAEIVESGTGDAHFDWSVGSQVVEELCREHAVASPVFAAGDAIFFDHYCLHRTGVTPTMTETRYAIESWFFAPSHFPMDYTGFLL